MKIQFQVCLPAARNGNLSLPIEWAGVEGGGKEGSGRAGCRLEGSLNADAGPAEMQNRRHRRPPPSAQPSEGAQTRQSLRGLSGFRRRALSLYNSLPASQPGSQLAGLGQSMAKLLAIVLARERLALHCVALRCVALRCFACPLSRRPIQAAKPSFIYDSSQSRMNYCTCRQLAREHNCLICMPLFLPPLSAAPSLSLH